MAKCRICGEELEDQNKESAVAHSIVHRRKFNQIIDGVDGMECDYELVVALFKPENASEEKVRKVRKLRKQSRQASMGDFDE